MGLAAPVLLMCDLRPNLLHKLLKWDAHLVVVLHLQCHGDVGLDVGGGIVVGDHHRLLLVVGGMSSVVDVVNVVLESGGAIRTRVAAIGSSRGDQYL